ncbi:MAG: hypothetical protein KAG96_00620 [Ichthyobacteriaceae bacterium]|nr:hypothetical protein [Ichthyobacteriaceae bacterium]
MNYIKETYTILQSFFPVKLLLTQLRTNVFLLIFWFIIIGFITGDLGNSYGLRHVFLAPEYFGESSFWSFFALGVGFGLFSMAFHVTSYVYLSNSFPFLATLNKPLLKFAINNSAFPFATFIIYEFSLYSFMNEVETGVVFKDFILLSTGFLLGSVTITSLIFTYFFSTNKNVLELFGESIKKTMDKPLDVLIKKSDNIAKKEISVKYYLKNPFEIRLVRDTQHYQEDMLLSVIQKHHNNAGLFMISIFLFMILLGVFSDSIYLRIPAAVTVLFTFSLYIMILGVIETWFRRWTFIVTTLLFVGINHVSSYFLENNQSRIYGLEYTVKSNYDIDSFNAINNDSINKHDYDLGLKTLQKWKLKNSTDKNSKPKLLFINTSGGGQRSAMWTFSMLNKLDSTCGFNLLKNTHLITGASGGMLGAAYYRQLYKEYGTVETTENFHKYYNKLGKDVLNPILFTYLVNDLFFPFKKFKYNNIEYIKDRGTILENEFIANIDSILEFPIKDLYQPEVNSEIPMMIFSPTIINDGRKLLISPLPISYLSHNEISDKQVRTIKDYDAVEYSRFFKKQKAENTRFMSALRVSATFPYISPLPELPTIPRTSLIDAGVRDNLGIELTIRYINTYKDWIKENTSGIVMLQIKADRPSHSEITSVKPNFFNTLVTPIGGVMNSFSNMQGFSHSQIKEYAISNFGIDVEIMKFYLFEKEEKISLSWHLTDEEKHMILKTTSSTKNKESLNKFNDIIEQNNQTNKIHNEIKRY